MEKLNKYNHAIATVEKAILFVLVTAICLAIFLEVLLRYVFHAPLLGIEDVALLVAYWLYFIGASLSTYEDTHIKAEAFRMFIKSESATRLIEFGGMFASFFTCCVFSYFAFQYCLWTLKQGWYTGYLEILLIYYRTSLFVGFAFMTMHLILKMAVKISQKA